MAYIGNQPTIGQYRKLDDISGSFNGSLTAFTMQVGSTNVTAGSAFQLLISLGGVIQEPGTDFTVSGSTITFTTAPAASLSFFGILMGQPLNTATPGDSTVTGAKIVDGTITGDKLAAAFNYDSGLLFLDDTNNRVGIGETSPNRQLVVNGGTSEGVIQITNNTSGTAAANGFELIHFTNGETQLLNRENGAMRFDTNGSESMRIDTSGRLLVGLITGNNRNLLQIQGDVDNGANGVGGISLRRGVALGSIGDGSQLGQLDFCMSDGGVAARIICDAEGSAGTGDYPGRLQFETTADAASSPTERMRINSAGYLDCHQGAGAAFGDDAHAFRRDNTSDTYVAKFLHEGTSVPKGLYIQYRNANPNSSGSPFLICLNNNGSTFARINSNGGFWNVQSNDSNICDEREKKNIVDLDSTWNCLKEWELKKFHYNDDADDADLRYGVIAQQIATSCPEVITDWIKQEASDAVLDEDGNEIEPAREEIVRMGVKEQQMYWMAIRALQEAQTRIETLEAEVAALKGS